VAELIRRAPADLRTSLTGLVNLWKQHDPRKYADLFVARANIGKFVNADGKKHRNG
jgi:hypothetical protein